jgi:hypothetical protein
MRMVPPWLTMNSRFEPSPAFRNPTGLGRPEAMSSRLSVWARAVTLEANVATVIATATTTTAITATAICRTRDHDIVCIIASHVPALDLAGFRQSAMTARLASRAEGPHVDLFDHHHRWLLCPRSGMDRCIAECRINSGLLGLHADK